MIIFSKVAGIFAKLNDVRLSAGRPPLGFVNPFLYQSLSQTQTQDPAFFDVVVGENKSPESFGFKAIEGWDPVVSS